MTATDSTPRRRGVQSLERGLELLDALAASGGTASLSDVAATTGLPMPTAHRIMTSLMAMGYVRKDPRRRYVLGAKLIRLGEAAGSTLGHHARTHLVDLVDAVGETANLALLDGVSVVYVGQAPSPHSMRMFTEVGRRVAPYCTGVGKAILATFADETALDIACRGGMIARTQHTITSRESMALELARIREQGYAVDDGEQEVGVRCVAVAVPAPATPLAVSVSGPSARVTTDRLDSIVPVLQVAAERIAAGLA